MTFRFVVTAIVLSSSLIISGCIGSQRAYEGISRAPEEIAVVKGSGSPTDERILIDVADGKSFNPSVIGGKADVIADPYTCLLIARSGHSRGWQLLPSLRD